MMIFVGRFVLVLTVVFGFVFSFNDYSYPNAINIDLLLWTILLLTMGIWTLRAPKPAFISILIFYLATVVYRCLVLEGEILLFLLVDAIFIVSMILSIWAAFKTNK
jgi:hypothetical protein